MSRPPLEVADLVRTAGTAFLERNRQWIRWPHIKVLLAIARCRTAALGGHIDECSRCGHRATIYSPCRSNWQSDHDEGRAGDELDYFADKVRLGLWVGRHKSGSD